MNKVSVIVPIYNVSAYLDDCINSIVTQTYSSFEAILIDDGSTDGGGEICDRWAAKDNRIKVVHQSNEGISSARNRGLELAAGSYIAFLDGDDYFEPDTLEKFVHIAEKTNADMIVCRGRRVSEDGKSIVSENAELYCKESSISEEEFWLRYTKDMYYIVAWSKLYKRELFNGVRFPIGEINEDEAILWMIVSKCKSIYASNDIIYNYRIRNFSIMRSCASRVNLQQPERLLDEIEYIKSQDFSDFTKKSVIRYAFVKGTGIVANAYDLLPKDADNIKKLDALYQRYIPVAKCIEKMAKGYSKSSLVLKSQMFLYCHFKKLYFTIRKIRKKVMGI